MPWRLLIAGLLCLLLGAPPAEAQPRVLGPETTPLVEPQFDFLDNANRSHLDRVEQFLADGQGEEAIDNLRRVMETDGDKLLAVKEYHVEGKSSFVRYYPARYICNQKLAALAKTSPETLALYRSRVDRIAERWLKQGIEERNPQLVERVASRLFASSHGDAALWQAGELALSQGRYSDAREAWERLSPVLRIPHNFSAGRGAPLPLGRPLWLALRGLDLEMHWPQISEALAKNELEANWLAFPDTDISLAEIRARLVLVSIMEGNRERAAVELDLLRRLHPDATGYLGGRNGRFVDLLGALLEQSAAWPAPAQRGTWPTFAGAPGRNRVAPQELQPRDKAAWEISLPGISSDGDLIGRERPRVAEHFKDPGLLSYHPVIWNDLVLVAEHTQIRALKLADGTPAWEGTGLEGAIYRFGGMAADDESGYPVSKPHPTARPYVGVARMTLTVYGDRLFARMGSRVTNFAEPNPADVEKQGVIVGLDLRAQGRMLRGFPLRPESELWNFEGTPVCDGGNLYVAMRKHDQVNSQAHVACYDLASGELRWRRWVCSAATPSGGKADELSHNLLTLAEGSLYYNTNLGSVAKIATEDGSIQWAMQYPRGAFPNADIDRRDRHFFRDLTPCVFHQGMVVCAPSDTDRLFAIDAGTGHLVWTSDLEVASSVVHLLGVQGNYLVASGDYLQWFDVFTGQHRGQYPPPQKDGVGFELPSPTGYGRGLLAGGHVYWPSRQRIEVFAMPGAGDATWAAEPVRFIAPGQSFPRGGNLVLAGDKLLVTGATKMQAFGNQAGAEAK